MDEPINNGRPLPPMETRWKLGQSGNPKGRPKKKDSLSNSLDKLLEETCPTDLEKRNWGDLFVHARLRQALKGDARAANEIWERHEGRVASVENIVVEKIKKDEPERAKETIRGGGERVRLSRQELNEYREYCGLPLLEED